MRPTKGNEGVLPLNGARALTNICRLWDPERDWGYLYETLSPQDKFPLVVQVNIWIRIISCLRLCSEISCFREIFSRFPEFHHSGKREVGKCVPKDQIKPVLY